MLLQRLHAIALVLYTSITMVLCWLVVIPAMIITRSGNPSIWIARKVWSPTIAMLAGLKLHVHGQENIPEGPAIFASNHESALDITVLFLSLPRNSLRFIAKRELFQMPIFGWYMWAAGHIKVDRRNRAQAFASLQEAGRRIRGGASVIVYPEGTRSRDSRVHPFKKGPFILAMEAQVPIVPIAIVGTSSLAVKGKFAAKPGTVHVSIGKPIDPRQFDDRVKLLKAARASILEMHVAHGGLGGDPDDVAAVGVEGSAASAEMA